jgi:hypothetical protein
MTDSSQPVHWTTDPQCIHRSGCLYATACHEAGHCTSTTHSQPDDEPPEPDGECYRGGEAASALAEEQAWIQRNLK